MLKDRVLIVEPDNAFGALLCRALLAEGVTFRLVKDGASGLSSWQVGHGEVVLLARELPDMDAFSLLRDILAQSAKLQRTTRIVVSSANPSTVEGVLALGLGAFDYLRRPVSLAQLRTNLRAASTW